MVRNEYCTNKATSESLSVTITATGYFISVYDTRLEVSLRVRGRRFRWTLLLHRTRWFWRLWNAL